MVIELAAPLEKFITHVDEAELVCRMIESASFGEFKRPAGISAIQTLSCLPEQDLDRWLGIAEAVMIYVCECVERAQRLQ